MGLKYTYTNNAKLNEKTLAMNIKTSQSCNTSTNFYHKDGRSEAVMQKHCKKVAEIPAISVSLRQAVYPV